MLLLQVCTSKFQFLKELPNTNFSHGCILLLETHISSLKDYTWAQDKNMPSQNLQGNPSWSHLFKAQICHTVNPSLTSEEVFLCSFTRTNTNIFMSHVHILTLWVRTLVHLSSTSLGNLSSSGAVLLLRNTRPRDLRVNFQEHDKGKLTYQ